MQRQVENWKQEHADELKDDAREYADRCLKSEREAAETTAPTPAAEEADAGQEKDAAAPAVEDVAPAVEDTRRLVYDDIWDDVPPAQPVARSVPPPQADARASERAT